LSSNSRSGEPIRILAVFLSETQFPRQNLATTVLVAHLAYVY